MQPGSQERPEALEGVDLAEAIAVLPGRIRLDHDRRSCGRSRDQEAWRRCYTHQYGRSSLWLLDDRVACWTLASIRITTWPPRSIMPKIGGFSFSKVPRPPFSLLRRPSRPLARTASGLPLCPATT